MKAVDEARSEREAHATVVDIAYRVANRAVSTGGAHRKPRVEDQGWPGVAGPDPRVGAMDSGHDEIPRAIDVDYGAAMNITEAV